MLKNQLNKIFTPFIIIIISVPALFAQTNKPAPTAMQQLSKNEITLLLTEAVKNEFGINYPVWKVYKCKDKSADFYIVLTESFDGITADKDTLHHEIKGFNLLSTNNKLIKQWEINDFVIKPSKDDDTETSIWFWTKYTELNDLDGDGLIDPVIVYGSSALNGLEDGRIKILLFYKGQKIAIRHQNGVLDFERNTQVDAAFYTLPLAIQNNIEKLMRKIMDDGNAIFPAGWEAAMKKHKLKFDERH